MEAKNCRGCGRLFNYMQGQPLCPACVAALVDKFQQLKEYLMGHPKASMSELSEENDVSVKQIKQWVREERLTFTEESQVTLECEVCGSRVLTGRFCERCKMTMHNDFTGAISQPFKPEKKREAHGKDQMRFLK